MYGLIGQMKAAPGKRAELAAILLEGTCASSAAKNPRGLLTSGKVSPIYALRDRPERAVALGDVP